MEIRDLVKALLAYDAIAARQWLADCERAKLAWSNIPMPENVSAEELSLAAAVAELMAERSGSPAPMWTRDISANARRVFLVRAAKNMPRLRKLCEEEGPEPLRRRQFFAPPDFLTVA